MKPPRPRAKALKKRKGALVSERALHFDGDKPNSVRLIAQPDDHLSQLTCVSRPTRLRAP